MKSKEFLYIRNAIISTIVLDIALVLSALQLNTNNSIYSSISIYIAIFITLLIINFLIKSYVSKIKTLTFESLEKKAGRILFFSSLIGATYLFTTQYLFHHQLNTSLLLILLNTPILVLMFNSIHIHFENEVYKEFNNDLIFDTQKVFSVVLSSIIVLTSTLQEELKIMLLSSIWLLFFIEYLIQEKVLSKRNIIVSIGLFIFNTTFLYFLFSLSKSQNIFLLSLLSLVLPIFEISILNYFENKELFVHRKRILIYIVFVATIAFFSVV